MAEGYPVQDRRLMKASVPVGSLEFGDFDDTLQMVPELNAKTVLRRLMGGADADAKALRKFFRWLISRWDSFCGKFAGDGTMTFKEFKRFVFWEQKWEGSISYIFEVLDPDGTGHIHSKDCHHAKRWFYHGRDLNDVDLNDCRRKFQTRHRNLGIAWRVALDPSDSGSCCFNVFCKSCHAIGVMRNLGKIWAELTDGYADRLLRFRDFDPEGDRLITHFATGLAIRGGCLRDGFDRMCNEFGERGKMKLNSFINFCRLLNIDRQSARRLLAILDPTRREVSRVLSQYDTLCFLSQFDPGNVDGLELGTFATTQNLEEASYDRKCNEDFGRPFMATPVAVKHPFLVVKQDPYKIILVLSKAEHEEYLRRQLSRLVLGGSGLAPVRSKARVEQSPAPDNSFEHMRKYETSDALWDKLMDGGDHLGFTPSTAAPTPCSTTVPKLTLPEWFEGAIAI